MRRLKQAKYRFRRGSRYSGDAEVVALELDSIRDGDGDLLPETVIQAASKKHSALHPYFTWDDTEAARKQRLTEARTLIRSVEVVYLYKEPGKSQEVEVVSRQFSNLNDKGGQGREPYRRTVDVLDDPQLRDRLFKKAWNELLRWRENYRGLQEFQDLFIMIDSLDL